MTHELKGREIFAVGIWNDMEFSEADLDDIVANFDKLKDIHKVPLKFGHNEDQEITDGQPAIGWVSRIFKQGEKLFADFSDMPRTVFEAIKNKLYRTVSIELLFNVDSDGNKFNHVLDAIALLGADHPAVSSLADLDALLATRTVFHGGHRVMFRTTAGTTKKLVVDNKEDFELEEKDVQKLIDKTTEPLAEANAKLTKDLEAATKLNAKFAADKADDEKKRKEDKVKLARKAVNDVLDTAVKSKACTPALRESYEKQIGVDDDDRVVDIDLKDVKAMFNVPEDTKQTGLHKTGNDNDDDTVDDPAAKLKELTLQNQADTGEKSFQVSFMRVAKTHPKLHLKYLNSNGEARR